MIPEFDEYGHLPPGIYEVTFDQVKEQFSLPKTLSRRKRTASLEAFYDTFKPLIKYLYIDGSYITDKPDPADVDIVVFWKDDFIHTDEHTYRLMEFMYRKESSLDIRQCKSRDTDQVNSCWQKVVFFQTNARDYEPPVEKGIILVRGNDND